MDLIKHPGSQLKRNGSLGPLVRDIPVEDQCLLLRCGDSSGRDWTMSQAADNMPEVHGLKESFHLAGSWSRQAPGHICQGRSTFESGFWNEEVSIRLCDE